ncbi:hypothetical protein [Pseudobdellovibrio exovorus]|uniref:Lipoprotein n=1 Tax=Pseudobdellovibrio exovorus JSS TaxID=1184267 RepID=M4V8R8_9BACT|nr:hypothetical protein [Pseudobdellovibrio exovorus]AGH95802.1 hypothetical protein A11Q_1586 [Pseudobdellovibrio exovorus JSS]
MKRQQRISVRTLICLFLVAGFLGCATPLKTSEIQSKIEPGSSRADTLVTLGIPDSRQTLAEGREVFFYFDTGVYFVADKLVHVYNVKTQNTSDLLELEKQMQEKWNEIPDVRNKLVFTAVKGPVNAYRAFYYLNDEVNFREAIRHRVEPEGYSSDLNAFCLAVRGGFMEAIPELLEIKVRTDMLIRDHRAGRDLLRVEECVQFQEDKAKAEKIKQMMQAQVEKIKQQKAAATANPNAAQEPEAESKSVVDWDAIKDWLKPQVPQQAPQAPQNNDQSK